MGPNLIRYIRQAQHRVFGAQLTANEALVSEQARAVDEFKLLIAQKLSFNLQIELLLSNDPKAQDGYFWSDAGPALRFRVDDRELVLVLQGGECQLNVEEGTQLVQAATLRVDDDMFEDRLLCALGNLLLPRADVPQREAGARNS